MSDRDGPRSLPGKRGPEKGLRKFGSRRKDAAQPRKLAPFGCAHGSTGAIWPTGEEAAVHVDDLPRDVIGGP